MTFSRRRPSALVLLAVLGLAAGACGRERVSQVVSVPSVPLPTLDVLPTRSPSPEPSPTTSPVSPSPARTPDPACAPSLSTLPTGPSGDDHPTSLAIGPDGAVWFAAGSVIGRMTTDGSVTPHDLPTDVRAFAIAPGPDGALWFTDQGTTAIGRITTSGAVRMFPTPTREGNPIGVGGAANPYSITSGPDGAMWFTESAADRIGRIDMAGRITEYRLPSYERMHANPQGITTGPDGKLWFAQPLIEAVGSFDPKTERFTDHTLPVEDSGPSDITSAHGALWFTDPGNGIGRMTTSGEARSFPLEADARAWQIGEGSGDDAWFMEQRHHYLATVGATGKITKVATLPKGSVGVEAHPSIVRGPDGATWFVLSGAGAIGRFGCPST